MLSCVLCSSVFSHLRNALNKKCCDSCRFDLSFWLQLYDLCVFSAVRHAAPLYNFLLSQKHTDQPDQSVASLLWSTKRLTTRSYNDIYFLTRVPGDDSLLRHSHNHPHTHETAIWSNLGFSILPKNIDRTVDPLIREAVCFTSWVTASPEKRTFSEVFLEKSVLKRQTLKMSV